MAVVILPDAQNDLLSLQEYMLDQWSERDWIKAEEEIFDKLERVDREGFRVPSSASYPQQESLSI